MNYYYLVFLSLLLGAACGVKKPPLPPIADSPQQADEREATQRKKELEDKKKKDN